jgi:predicted transcriptional regulator of viral defense system
MVTRIQIAKQDIVKYFDNHPKRVFDKAEINSIYEKNRPDWRLAKAMSVEKFIDFLVKNGKLKIVKFRFPIRAITKYTWGDVSLYQILANLRPKCYFTHYTAMYFHQLTEQIPKVIYVNVEQTPKPKSQFQLEQSRIDIAFKRPPRLSRNFTEYANYKICLLNGMFTGNNGVIEMPGPEGEKLQVTDVERTLIDITVRPEYAGGVFEVLKAFKNAHQKVSVNRLAAMLRKINYTYPYHQAIGFYMDKSGVYSSSQIELLQKFDVAFDFYLAHELDSPHYSAKWRLYLPEGLQ